MAANSGFPALTTAEQVFYDVIWTPMIKAGEVWIAGAEAGIPLLDLGFVQGIENSLIQTLTDAIYGWLIKIVDIEAIQLVDAQRQAAYEAASEQLVLIGQSQGVTSDAYKTALATALKNFDSFGKLGS